MIDLAHLLASTSRTFALAIPLLPEPTQRQVTLAYLLLRIADSIEDAQQLPVETKARLLFKLSSAMDAGGPIESPFEHELSNLAPYVGPSCGELLGHTGGVLGGIASLPEAAREIIVGYTQRTIHGMVQALRNSTREGGVELGSLAELRNYCYTVAGLVGELLTELFLLRLEACDDVSRELRDKARYFGEGLQLTNILKDARDDVAQGRRFIPRQVSAETVFSLARADLELARAYVKALGLASAPEGFLAFTLLPLQLAEETLEVVNKEGPGAKVSRKRVGEILQGLDACIHHWRHPERKMDFD